MYLLIYGTEEGPHMWPRRLPYFLRFLYLPLIIFNVKIKRIWPNAKITKGIKILWILGLYRVYIIADMFSNMSHYIPHNIYQANVWSARCFFHFNKKFKTCSLSSSRTLKVNNEIDSNFKSYLKDCTSWEKYTNVICGAISVPSHGLIGLPSIYVKISLANPVERTVIEYSDRSLTVLWPFSDLVLLWLRTIKKHLKLRNHDSAIKFELAGIGMNTIILFFSAIKTRKTSCTCYWRQWSGSPFAEGLHHEGLLLVETVSKW